MMTRSWLKGILPIVLVAVPFGLIYTLMLYFLTDAVDAEQEIVSWTDHGGPSTLFLMNSGALGWAVVVVIEKTLGLARWGSLGIALCPWALAIGGGFALAVPFTEHLPDSTVGLAMICAAATLGTGAFRTWLADLF